MGDAMKVSKEQSAEHYRAILHAAAAIFRVRGFDRTTVADVMHSAGLTHGAFYGHFHSKSHLAALACQHAFSERLQAWKPDISLADYLDGYVSAFHRDRPGQGCPMVAFSAEIQRQEKAVRSQFHVGVSLFLERISVELAAVRGNPAGSAKDASAILSTMVGAVVLARSIADRRASTQILKETRSSIAQHFKI